MIRWEKLCAAIYWIAMTIWVGAVMAVGVTAVTTFSVLPDEAIGLTLEKFDQFDRSEHGRIAAGLVNEPAFTFTDVVQVGAAGLVLLALVLQLTLFRQSWKRPANTVRAACIVIATCLLAIRMIVIMPDMNRELRAYWSAAAQGNHDAAMIHRQTFDRSHRIARPMFDATLLLLLVAVAGSGIASVRPSDAPGR